MTRGLQQSALSSSRATAAPTARSIPFPPCPAAQLTSLALFSRTSHTKRMYGTCMAPTSGSRHFVRPPGGTQLQVHIPLKVQVL